MIDLPADDFGDDVARGLAALEAHLTSSADDTRDTVWLAARSLAKAHPTNLVDQVDLTTALGTVYDQRRIAVELAGLVANGRLYALGEGLYSLIPVTVEHDQDDVDQDDQAVPVPQPTGETKAVRELRNELAEGRKVRELAAELLALDLDTERVRRRRRDAAEAAKLHVLTNDPAVKAWQSQKAVKTFTAAGLIALVLALGWSTANVHTFAAAGAEQWSARWWFAWAVEPFLSLALLAVVGSKAFLAVRGRLVTSPTLTRIERGFLALTLAMQLFPVLPEPVGMADTWNTPNVVLHCLGPIIAVAIVHALPIIWAEFAAVDHGLPVSPTADPTAPTGRPTPPPYRENAELPDSRTVGVPESGNAPTDHVTALTEKAVKLIRAGKLRPGAGAETVRKALECGMTPARQVRTQLRARGL